VEDRVYTATENEEKKAHIRGVKGAVDGVHGGWPEEVKMEYRT
jgi:hypothetical protein